MQTVDSSKTAQAGAADAAWRGIELCRQGDWQEGLYWLGLAAEPGGRRDDLPGLFYAYLGYGIARYQGQQQQGIQLCQRAVETELYQPEGYYFLARTQLLAGDRRAAFDVIERGLEVDSANIELLALKDELGKRRPPVLPFLARGHALNRWLGKIRHRLLGPERHLP